jgi:hypothetical protein
MDAKEMIRQLHEDACKQGADSYIDPSTGYKVFTSLYHLARGYCCDSMCRHCPYSDSERGDGKESSNKS